FNKCCSKEQCEKCWNIFKCYDIEKFAIAELRLLALQDNPKKFINYQNSKNIIIKESTPLNYREVDKTIIELINKNTIKSMNCFENRIYVCFEDGSKYCCC